MFDIIIKNGTVYDGSGCNEKKADLGIKGGRITAIHTSLSDAAQIIDAQGKIVCPGFIDMHSHSGLKVFTSPALVPKIKQGITSEVIGVDGISVAPVISRRLSERQQYVSSLDGKMNGGWGWRTYPEYLAHLQQTNKSTNLVPLVPHGAVRDVIIGLTNRPATPGEIRSMCNIVEQAFRKGARGLSFGLIYLPGAYAEKAEITALVGIAAKYDALTMVHVRNEAESVVESIHEIAEIGAKHNAKMHISHLKIIGQRNKHLLHPVLASFEDYNAAGISLSFDQYPYNAGNTQLAVLVPPWAHDGGPAALLARLKVKTLRDRMRRDMEYGLKGWENLYYYCGWNKIYVVSLNTPSNQFYVGQSIEDMAAAMNKDPFDAVFDLLLEERLEVGMIDFYGDEQVMQAFMCSPFQTVGTDGIFCQHPHPRLYGTYPRILGKYVREKKLMPLAQAIHKMTERPANLLGLKDRGLLRESYKADVVVFDADTVTDKATYQEPKQFPVGIEWVIVNGKVTLDNKCNITNLCGKLL